MNFRKDINGLRAIAVIAVVVFHFNEQWLPGGFAGVDVFFVISGYLMTKIIISGIEKHNFSVVAFYLSRAKRIIPALAFLIFVLMIFGWFFLSMVDYSTLSKHSISSLGFFSNLYYLSESGYFDVSSNKKWLLHTWSLSVEWQFYIFYPLLLLLAVKIWSLTFAKWTVNLLCVVSFSYCVYLSYISPNSAFYILPTRAWEMMVGGIAFLYPLNISKKTKNITEVLGVTMIILTCIFISEDLVWPGYLSLVPVIGTYLIIVSTNNSFLTNNVLMQHIGMYSYSIYLWHWPILLFLRYFGLVSNMHLILGMLTSIVVGYFSYSLIEKKSSFPIEPSNFLKILTFPPIIITFVLSLSCFVVYKFGGIPSRLDSRVVIAANESNNKANFQCQRSKKTDHCLIGNLNNIVAVVVGDSHAEAVFTAVAEAINLEDDGVVLITASACPFILGAKITTRKHCFTSNQDTLEMIKNSYSELPVIIINRTSVYIYGQTNPLRIKKGKNSPLVYFDLEYESVNNDLLQEFELHFASTMCNLVETNPVYITTPIPEMLTHVPDLMSNRMLVRSDFSDYTTQLNAHLKRNEFALGLMTKVGQECGVEVLSTEKFLCKNGDCLGSINGRPLYFDGDHLSEYGNKLLTPMFKQVFSK